MKKTQRLKNEFAYLRSPAALGCLGAGLLASLVCLAACGRLWTYSFLLLPRHAPPAFLFFSLFVLVCGLLSFLAGLSRLTANCCAGSAPVVLYALAAFFWLLFYIAFMRGAAFVFALLMLIACLVLQGAAFVLRSDDLLLLHLIRAFGALITVVYFFLVLSVILLN